MVEEGSSHGPGGFARSPDRLTDIHEQRHFNLHTATLNYELEVMVFVVIVALIVWGACFLRKKLHDRPSSHGNG